MARPPYRATYLWSEVERRILTLITAGKELIQNTYTNITNLLQRSSNEFPSFTEDRLDNLFHYGVGCVNQRLHPGNQMQQNSIDLIKTRDLVSNLWNGKAVKKTHTRVWARKEKRRKRNSRREKKTKDWRNERKNAEMPRREKEKKGKRRKAQDYPLVTITTKSTQREAKGREEKRKEKRRRGGEEKRRG